MFLSRGLDSSVGIATRYGLDGPGNRIPVGAKFFARVETCPGAHPSSYTMGTESFLGVKRPGRGVDHPLQRSSEVQERVELYMYSPFCNHVKNFYFYQTMDEVQSELSSSSSCSSSSSSSGGSSSSGTNLFLNNQPDALIIQIYSVIKLYMFRASSLPIIRSSLLYVRHW